MSEMDVHVVGRHLEIAPELRAAVLAKVTKVGRFAADVRRVDVDFAETEARRAEDRTSCEVLVHVNRHLVKATAHAPAPLPALDRALAKVEQQLRRLHDRRTDKLASRRDGGPGR